MLQEYQQLIQDGIIVTDAAQRRVARRLHALQVELESFKPSVKKRGIFSKIFSSSQQENTPHGLYIYGDVGRGKSMLMDLFFTNVNFPSKRRVHFHAFMLEVHAKLYAWRTANKDNHDAGDPIPDLARGIVDESMLLCFDELQVSDITDAMILGRLFTHIFELGGIVVATSNREPKDLYKDGFQRDRFEPFIELIYDMMEIEELDSLHDYRLQHLKSFSTVYFTPLGKEAEKFLAKSFADLTQNARPRPETLMVQGRHLTIEKTASDVAWCTFSQLCEEALGAADYLEIASEFSTVLLDGVPALTKEQRNEARRFVNLIDALYEHRVKLVCTADIPPQEIYPHGDGSFEFQRTVSRLIEMQSESYLAKAHIV